MKIQKKILRIANEVWFLPKPKFLLVMKFHSKIKRE